MGMVMCSFECSSEQCVLSIGALHKPFNSIKEAFQWLIANQNEVYSGGGHGAV